MYRSLWVGSRGEGGEGSEMLFAWTKTYLQVEHAGLGGVGDVLADGDLVESCFRGGVVSMLFKSP